MNKGDIVRLKSSDVKMTVRYVREATVNQQNQKISAICEWMDLDHKLHSHEFAITSLEKV